MQGMNYQKKLFNNLIAKLNELVFEMLWKNYDSLKTSEIYSTEFLLFHPVLSKSKELLVNKLQQNLKCEIE